MREVRTERGETQASIAERLGMKVSNYQRMEHGQQNMTLVTLGRVAEALGVPVGALFVRPRGERGGPGRPPAG